MKIDETKGFTLIELMIVVAVIGILAGVASGKFSDLVSKSKESSVKSAIGSMKSALSLYYSDNDDYPTDLEIGLTSGGKYLNSIPTVSIPTIESAGLPGHTSSNNISLVDDDWVSGAWQYYGMSAVSANCTHVDSKGVIWSHY